MKSFFASSVTVILILSFSQLAFGKVQISHQDLNCQPQPGFDCSNYSTYGSCAGPNSQGTYTWLRCRYGSDSAFPGQIAFELSCTATCFSNVYPENDGTDVPRSPAKQCGSIIKVDSQSLGEEVEVPGTEQRLVYFSDRVVGRKADYTLKIPVFPDPVDQTIASANIEILWSNRSLSENLQNVAGGSYTLDWDGRDASGNLFPRATIAQVRLKYQTSTIGEVSYIADYKLGAWKSILVGLGGWTLSDHHFYDVILEKLFTGDAQILPMKRIGVVFENGSYRKAIETDQVYRLMVSSSDGNQAYIFDLDGYHLETRSARTGSLLKSFSYDQNKRLMAITDAFGNVTNISRPSATQVLITAPRGQVTTMFLNSDGWAERIVLPSNRQYQMTYADSNGLLTSFEKPSGAVSNFIYSANGLLEKDQGPNGFLLEYLKQITTNQQYSIFQTTGEGRQTKYDVTLNQGRFTRVEKRPSGLTVTTTDNRGVGDSVIDSTGNGVFESKAEDFRFESQLLRPSQSSQTKMGESRVYTYVTSQNYPGANILNLDFLQTLTTDFYASTTWKVRYDGLQNQETLNTPLNRTDIATYNELDQLISFQSRNFSPIQMQYDNLGRLQRIQNDQRVSEISYNPQGQVASIKNALNQTRQFLYDADDRLVQEILPDQRVLEYTYDANGNLNGVRPPAKPIHTLTYNLLDLLEQYIAPAIGAQNFITQYQYNKDKQLTKVLRPDNSEIIFTYGAQTANLDSITTPEGIYLRQHDNDGRIFTASSPDQVVSTYIYNGWDINQERTQFVTFQSQVNYTYEAHLPKTITIQGSDLYKSSVTYGYDADRLVNQAGDMTIIRDPGSGLIISTQLKNTREEFAYDPSYGELSSYRVLVSNVEVFREDYVRDLLGRLTSKTNIFKNELGVTITDSWSYTYDSSGRLSTSTKNGQQKSYTYDSNSNITRIQRPTSRTNMTYDAQDRLLTWGKRKYTYTAQGDRVLRYREDSQNQAVHTYNALGSLESVQKTYIDELGVVQTKNFSYVTDAFGRRIERIVNGEEKRRYVYDSQGRLMAEINLQGKVKFQYVYATKSHSPDFIMQNNQRFKLIHDHLGSVRLVINAQTGEVKSRIDYDEFGKVEPKPFGVGFQSIGFAGGIYDPTTRLTRFGARDYDADVGRWTAKDPILFSGGDSNLYGYVLADPINLVDRTGNSAEDVERIRKGFENSVNNMTRNGQRTDPGWLNNLSTSANALSGGALGSPYLACGGQADQTQKDLQGGKYDDNWNFEWQGETNFGGLWKHQYLKGTSSNPNDPTIRIDPWNNRFTPNWR